MTDPSQAARARRREMTSIPDQVCRTGKWRLALEMFEEMTGAAGWGVLGRSAPPAVAAPVVVADAGYGDGLPTWSRSRAPPVPMRRALSR